MRHLKTIIHPKIETLENKTMFKRDSARAIVLDGEMILMVYVGRYDDYSLPGGGLNKNEDKVSGMIRELVEETGAQNIHSIKEFGVYEEYRSWYKPDFDIQHMISYCYTCKADRKLGETSLEENEIRNQTRPLWINIHEAIEHNEKIMASSPKKGLSIERETFLLHLIKKELLNT